VYRGPSFSISEVKNALTETGGFGGYVVTRHEVINAEVARLLAAGGIVARFRGRMEFGACALGNRSILAHPGNPDIIRIIWVGRNIAGAAMMFTPHMMALSPLLLGARPCRSRCISATHGCAPRW
jgi:hypothetical protein